VGVALGQGKLALALTTFDHANAITEIVRLAYQKGAQRVYVGRPAALSGRKTESTHLAMAFAKELQSQTQLPVLLLDERLTSVQSHRNLRQVGLRAKSAKKAIDSESARLIVELAIALAHNCGEGVGSDA
jgi:putative Holliday junction resolvase